MKKVFFIIGILLISLNVKSQKINKDFLIGKWISVDSEVEFTVCDKKEFKITSFSYLTNNDFKILGYQFNKGYFYLRTLHEQNNVEAIGKFFLIDENTMLVDYVGDIPGQTIYKRLIK